MAMNLQADQKVKIVLSNGLRYTGKILEIDVESLTLLDKYNEEVTIRRGDISVCSEVQNEN